MVPGNDIFFEWDQQLWDNTQTSLTASPSAHSPGGCAAVFSPFSTRLGPTNARSLENGEDGPMQSCSTTPPPHTADASKQPDVTGVLSQALPQLQNCLL